MPFRWDNSLTFPKMRQYNLETGRVYAVCDGPHAGNVYPSITRVLKAKPKPQLEAWKKRVGEEEAERIKQRAIDRGNPLHGIAESYLRNEPLPKLSPIVRELWVSRLKPWIDKNITCVYCIEQDVYSDMLGVSGRVDVLAEVRGTIAVVDFKNSKAPKKPEYVEDYFIQGSFYALAVFERTGISVKKVCVPVASPDELQPFETTPAKHFGELYQNIKTFYTDYEKELLTPDTTVV
jgi:hypothetical protein